MLTLVPTPIGNLEDISKRAITALLEAELIFCEDTRVTKKLLHLLSQRENLEFKCNDYKSFHSHNEKHVLTTLSPEDFNKNIVYVSDAGMPCVSDPGATLVQYCIENSIEYDVLPGANAVLNLYRCNANGKIEQQINHTLRGLPLIHDFCLAGEYLVFLVSPVRVNLGKVTLAQKSYSDSLEWKPALGTEILIFAKADLSLVSRGKTEPWFQWHFANGYVNDQGNIVTEFTRYENLDTNQYLKEVASGFTETPAKGNLWSLSIKPQTAEVVSNKKIADVAGDFPLVAPEKVGQEWRYTLLNAHH